jgi:hypothetical protein
VGATPVTSSSSDATAGPSVTSSRPVENGRSPCLIVQAVRRRNKVDLCYDEIVPRKDLARHAGKFVKHVLPAAVKPVHSLWHEVIGFIFLALAAIWAWWLYRHAESIGPVQMIIIIPLILIVVGYGISSFLKARRISRS